MRATPPPRPRTRPPMPLAAPPAATPAPRRGLRLLERAGGMLLPQGVIVATAKAAWRKAWSAMMTELAPQGEGGAYARPASAFTGVLGSPAFPFHGDDPAFAGRYRLYLGNACPWCHRVELALVARGLDGAIPVTRLDDDPVRASRGGWVVAAGEGGGKDPVFGGADLRAVYVGAAGAYTGRCTAPLLIDTATRTIVSNDSAGILAALDAVDGGADVRLRPAALAAEIDAVNDMLYESVCNGCYAAGFATSQAAYDAAFRRVAAGLDAAEARLAGSRFLVGDRATDADLRLLPTIARLDAVYQPLFRATDRPLAAWPRLAAWAVDVAALNGGRLRATVDIAAARASYFSSLFPLNPSGIVPCGEAGLRVLDGEGRGQEGVWWGRGE